MQALVDLYGCPMRQLTEVDPVRGFLETAVRRVEMQPISAPDVKEVPSGVTGIILLAESHISIHTIPRESRAFVDIFSCKGFDLGAVDSLLKEVFQPETSLYRVLYARGLENASSN